MTLIATKPTIGLTQDEIDSIETVAKIMDFLSENHINTEWLEALKGNDIREYFFESDDFQIVKRG